ncbi:MAG: thermonuclease family protein [Magnetococcales bacterium]|nr:thermonuclease family protein [Magnetococcales bacterium]
MTPSWGWAEEWRGRVVRVTDGDTLVVARAGGEERIRVAEIDTPEHGQPFAAEAKAFTAQMVDQKRVRVREKERDRYGRLVAWVTPEGEQQELGVALVRAGLAWRHIYYSKNRQLAKLEQEARNRKTGLWSEPNPTPPWVWKRNHRRGAEP